MKRNSFSHIPAEDHIALPLLRRYLADTLPAPERHQVEKHLLDCEMCTDILGGMEQNPEAKTYAAVQEINHRLETTIAKKKEKALPAYNWKSWGVAAAILLLLSSVLTIYYNLNNLGTQQQHETITMSAPGPKELPDLKPAEPPVLNQATTAPEANPAAVAPVKSPAANQRPENTGISAPLKEFPVATAPAVKDKPEAANIINPQTNGKPLFYPTDSVKTVATNAGSPKGNKIAVARTRLQSEITIDKEMVSGRVLDASTGEPIPGVTVLFKGTSIGSGTDIQGKFSLPLPENKTPVTLVYSFPGYTTEERVVTDPRRALADVTLNVDATQLSEVSVTGYSSNNPNDVTIAVNKAKPKGGMTAFRKYVQQNLKYPASARAKKIQGRVIVSFTVNLDGSVSGLNIIRSLTPDCDAEAMRLVREGPPWEPTRFDGKAVVQQVQVTIRFKLPK